MLKEALALWRGKPFEDVAYESFAQIEIERLEECRLAALEERIEAELALGKDAEVVAELEALTRQQPQRERLCGQLMLALYRSGRQADALMAYRNARRELVGELGIEPGSALRELEQAILRQDPELEVAAPPARTMPRERPLVVKGRFAERRRVLLVALGLSGIAAAAAGTAVAFLSGPGGGLSGIDPNAVGVIEPTSGKIVAEIPVGQRPTDLAADGGVWVTNFDSGTLSHVEPQLRKVVGVTNAGGTPTGLATGDGAVWVSNGFAGRVLRGDEETGRVTATIPIDGHPGAIAVDRNGVWVVNPIKDAVERIDPTTLQVTTIPVGSGPSGIAVGAGSIWVANGLERTLTQINSATGAVQRARIALRFAPTSVAFGLGSVWVAGTAADEVASVNPRDKQSAATIRVGDGPSRIAILKDRVWVADTLSRELTEIDPRRNAVVRTIKVGASPEGLVSVRGQLWVAAHGV
jgi:streptogramin lyase